MSDLLYPADGVPENKYAAVVLEFIPQLLYTVEYTPGEPMAVVWERASTPGSKPTVKTQIPSNYYCHLRRFLWRFYMFYNLYKVLHLGHTKVLLPIGIELLQRTLVMMDSVVEQLLLGCIALGHELSEHSRFYLFDLYLTTEFVVGYHDPGRVDAWRKNPHNRDLDLERINPHELGRSQSASSQGFKLVHSVLV